MTPIGKPNGVDRTELVERYCQIRAFTEKLCNSLETDDYVIQSIEDVSPPKWHLAHVSWFFETFLLQPQLKNFSPFSYKRSADSIFFMRQYDWKTSC